MSESHAWVFTGPCAQFPAGVFSSRENAESHIARFGLSGTLTRYTLNVLGYREAVTAGRFKPRRPDQETALFISRFSDGAEHYHYESGRLE